MQALEECLSIHEPNRAVVQESRRWDALCLEGFPDVCLAHDKMPTVQRKDVVKKINLQRIKCNVREKLFVWCLLSTREAVIFLLNTGKRIDIFGTTGLEEKVNVRAGAVRLLKCICAEARAKVFPSTWILKVPGEQQSQKVAHVDVADTFIPSGGELDHKRLSGWSLNVP